MKKIVVCLVLLLLIIVPVFAQTYVQTTGDFSNIFVDPFFYISTCLTLLLGLVVWKIGVPYLTHRRELRLLEMGKGDVILQEKFEKEIGDKIKKIEQRLVPNDQIFNDLEKIRSSIKIFSLHMYRSQLNDNTLDIYTRLEAGVFYMKNGGNGKGKAKTLELAKDNPEAWDTICRNHKDVMKLPDNFFEDSIRDINKLLDYK